jgi:hypothetical protein
MPGKLSPSGTFSIGLYVIRKYPARADKITTSPRAIPRRLRSWVMPATNGRRSHGAESPLTVAAQAPSAERLPSY